MDILHEIIETADNIMNELEHSDFYEQYIFCDPFKLRRELEMQMQRNWEQLEDIHLSDEQLMDIIYKVTSEGINKTFSFTGKTGCALLGTIEHKSGSLK